MKKRKLIAAFVFAIAYLVYGGNSFAITWERDLQQALTKAQSQKKPVVVDFFTAWCGWCTKLDTTTYADRKVQNLLRNFVCAKINGDKYPELVRKYNVRGYPTTLFLNADGSVLESITGYVGPQDFSVVVQKVLKSAHGGVKSGVRKAGSIKKKKEVFTLSAVIYDAKSPKAIINNTVVKIGDVIDGATVIAIMRDRATLHHRGQKLNLAIE